MASHGKGCKLRLLANGNEWQTVSIADRRVDNSGIGEEPEQDLRSELRTPPPAKRNFFDEARLGQFLDAARRADPQSAARSDSELLEQYEIVRKGQPTVAGILAFSRYPQQHFPRMTITAVVIPGLQMGDTDAQGARFLDDRRFTGSIPEMLEDAVVFIRRNAGLRVEADGQGRRRERCEYPIAAVREAIANALVHRNVGLGAENTPVSIEMYRDRLVIRNRVQWDFGRRNAQAVDLMGQQSPNPSLARILELLGIVANRRSGCALIQKEMAQAGLPAPEFRVEYRDWVTVFRNAS